MRLFSQAAVVLSMILTLMSAPAAKATDYNKANAAIVLALFAISTTTSFIPRGDYDSQKATELLDQAYAGSGEKLEILAGASGKSVEVVADTIICLEKEGKISAEKPEIMAEVIAAALLN